MCPQGSCGTPLNFKACSPVSCEIKVGFMPPNGKMLISSFQMPSTVTFGDLAKKMTSDIWWRRGSSQEDQRRIIIPAAHQRLSLSQGLESKNMGMEEWIRSRSYQPIQKRGIEKVADQM